MEKSQKASSIDIHSVLRSGHENELTGISEILHVITNSLEEKMFEGKNRLSLCTDDCQCQIPERYMQKHAFKWVTFHMFNRVMTF